MEVGNKNLDRDGVGGARRLRLEPINPGGPTAAQLNGSVRRYGGQNVEASQFIDLNIARAGGLGFHRLNKGQQRDIARRHDLEVPPLNKAGRA